MAHMQGEAGSETSAHMAGNDRRCDPRGAAFHFCVPQAPAILALAVGKQTGAGPGVGQLSLLPSSWRVQRS